MSTQQNDDGGPDQLKPCPFCGGDAELDANQAYCDINTGHIGTAISIYCVGCGVSITLCRKDMPEYSVDELVEIITNTWQKRQAPAMLAERSKK